MRIDQLARRYVLIVCPAVSARPRPVATISLDGVDGIHPDRGEDRGIRHVHDMVRASDLDEIRAATDILGHSLDMLMRTYAHVMPGSIRTVTDKIAQRMKGEA